MIGSLRENWKHTWAAVWSRLDESAKSPADLYSRLYEAARHYLSKLPDTGKEIEIKNDRGAGRAFFRSLRSEDFNGEQAIVAFLEEAYADLASLNDGSAAFFRDKCREFLSTYNLPYRICGEFEIRLMPIGPLAALCEEIRLLNAEDPHLAGLMDDFELLFQRYCAERRDVDLRNCLASFSKYHEALLKKTLGVPASTERFAALTGRLTTWPHPAVKAAIENLYGFCSNYPRIRHDGNPEGQLRDLKELDAVALSAFFLGFCLYLSDGVRESELIEA